MHFVEDDDVDEVHDDCGSEKVSAEGGADVEGDGQDERGEEVKEGFVDLSCLLVYAMG